MFFKGTNEYATEVEQCFCPEGYTGFSCESCAHGYYREKTSNKCVKCYCDNCDPIEGCLGCPTGFYRDNPSTEARPVCKPCDCNEREVKCGKDTNNNTYCLCKSGFSGLHCENSIAFTQSSSHLTIKITPSILTSDAAGSEAVFNCSYDSGEKLKLSFTKVYRDKVEGPFSGTAYPVITTKNGYQGLMSVSTLLEEELTEVECYVHNLRGKEVGRVVATIQTIGWFMYISYTEATMGCITKIKKNEMFYYFYVFNLQAHNPSKLPTVILTTLMSRKQKARISFVRLLVLPGQLLLGI